LATVPSRIFRQRLLDALTRHVARDRGVLVLAADLVDLVDVDDALLALLDVAAGGLQQLEDDVLDVLADVAGLGERGGVDDRERHREQLGQRLREQRLARAGGADEQDVRLVELDVVAAARLLLDLDALVVVVDRDGELLLGALLADDVLVEELLDFRGRGERRTDTAILEPVVVGDDVVADLDALVADEYRRSGNQLANVVLILVAERAAKDLGLAVLLDHLASVPWVYISVTITVTAPNAWVSKSSLHPFPDDVIDNPVFLPLVRRHDVVPFGIFLNPLERLARVVDQDLVQALAHAQDFPGVDVDVGGLPRQPLHERLVDHDSGIRQGVALALGAGASSTAAIDAAWPMQMVCTSGLMNCIVS
jgi:hypothetical protein